MKIISASVKVIDNKNHVQTLGLEDVEITIKTPGENPIKEIPEIKEEKPKKKANKKKKE